MIVDSLHLSQNIPTALQSLGCIAQHSPSVFEAHEEEITCYILEEVFAAPKVSVNFCDASSSKYKPTYV